MIPTVNYLTGSSSYNDFRPAIGPDGNTIIFERTQDNYPTRLYILQVSSPKPPGEFISGGEIPLVQTRPDWCWNTNIIAFNGSSGGNTPLSVYTVGSDGSNPTAVPNTSHCDYPTWDPAGKTLVCENNGGVPSPCNTWLNASDGTIINNNLSGVLLNLAPLSQIPLYGGMPTVGPKGLPQIAFAGQPQIKDWANQSKNEYLQEYNYIMLNNYDQPGTLSSSPMEQKASTNIYDGNYQGRAPAWSPDGRRIVFESNRSGTGYAIYVYDLVLDDLTQVTDPALNAQHAKFFPCGTKLVLCLNENATSDNTCIAWVDISGYFKS